MKILDVSSVTDSAQIKIKQGTLKFLQDANHEGFSAIMKALIGSTYNSLTAYMIYGGVNSGAGTNYIISEGVCFYNGEVYLVDAISFATTGIDVAILTIDITQYTIYADPVTFSDSSIHNVHNIRKVGVSAGVSGSGIANYASVYFKNWNIPEQVVITGTGIVTVSGVYPSVVVNVPASSNLHPVLYASNFNIGDVSGGQSYLVTFPSVGTADYYVMGTIISAGTLMNDANVYWVIKNPTATGFTIYVREASSSANNISLDYILFHK